MLNGKMKYLKYDALVYDFTFYSVNMCSVSVNMCNILIN